ncbi:MAG: cellulase family glycosylhydrolase [bacterium]|nr:cellulase family glycosylhydrolase [bacterium]
MKNNLKKYLVILIIIASFLAIDLARAESNDVLAVSGNQFTLNGAPILLSGMAMGDPHDRIVNYNRSSQADYKTIKNDWRANVVRLSVHPGVFINDWVRGKKILEDEVKAARDNGLLVIIDWHVIGEPDGWYKPMIVDKRQYYIYSSDFLTAKKFWQYAAGQFKADRGIIFELWNEPANEKNDLSWLALRPYMTQLTELIRNTGSQNIILAPAVNWGYDLRGIKVNPLSGSNIAYSWHVYNNGNSVSHETALDGLNKIYPVFITEWGSNNDNDLGFSVKSGQNVYNYLESVKNLIIDQNLSHTAWCWHSAWKPKMFNDDWRWANSYGSLVKDFLIYPEKVRQRLKADEKKRQELVEAAKKASQAKNSRTREFQLRLESYLANGADANSAKLSKKDRQAILDNFAAVYGHEPENENEWQDLMRINNGYWPSKVSQEAEDKAKEDFKKIFKRLPDMNINSDKHAVKILAYDIRQRAEKRSLGKERTAIAKFIKIFKYLPVNSLDWKFVHVLAYGGVNN